MPKVIIADSITGKLPESKVPFNTVVTVSPEKYGALGDGTTDDTTAFQEAVTAATALGAEVLARKGKTYVLNSVTLTTGARVRIEGTLLKKANTNGAILKGTSVSDVRISGNGTINGNKANQTTYLNGIGLVDFESCTDVLVEGITLTGHYLPLGEFSTNTFGCIYIKNSTRAVVRNCNVTNHAREGIWLELCNDSTIDSCTIIGGVDSWSGIQCSGTRNLVINCRSTDAGASGIGTDSTYSLVIGCHVRNNRYFHGFNFGHTGIPASYTQVIGCTYYEEAGVHLGAAGTGSGFSINASSLEVALIGCTSDGAATHGFNVSDSANRIRFTNCRAVNSGQYGLNFFSPGSGFSIFGSDLNLAGNTSGSFQALGTTPEYHLVNVRTGTSTFVNFVDSGTLEAPGNLTVRGNFLVSPVDGTSYRELAVARTSGGNVYKVVMAGSGTSGVILVTRDGTTFASVTFGYNAGNSRVTFDKVIQNVSYTTVGRPAAAVGVGSMYFDTTLNKPVWSDGINWRDAAGTIV